MRRSTAAFLLAVFVLAVVLRLSPLTRFVYFGSDIGEYYRVSAGLVTTGHVSLAYTGWGTTYPYFPGWFFVVVGTASGGLELAAAVSLASPILGAFVPVLVFLLGVRVFREDRAALVSAALVAVAMPTTFLTAHPAPAALGELLAVAGLFLFLQLARDRRTWWLIAPLSGALVVTHHLSTYFLVIMAATGLALRVLLTTPGTAPRLRSQGAYVLFLSGLAIAYWFGYAAAFRENILADVATDPRLLLVGAGGAAVLLSAAVAFARRRTAGRYRPRYPTLRHVAGAYAAAFAVLASLVALATAFGILGTTIRLPPETLLYFAPFFAFLALSAAGRRPMDFSRDGVEAMGWFLVLPLSVLLGLAVAPRVIIPYRHIEYIVLALSVPAGAGLATLADLGGLSRYRVTAAAVAAVLVAGTSVSAIPPTGFLGNFEEGARAEALDASYWAGHHAGGLLAADHRASSLAFGFGGVDATWDAAPLALTAPNFTLARVDMESVRAPSGVGRVMYVLVDRDLAAGVALSPYEPARPLTADALAKFSQPPYVRVFDNGYAQLYFVNWGCSQAPCP